MVEVVNVAILASDKIAVQRVIPTGAFSFAITKSPLPGKFRAGLLTIH